MFTHFLRVKPESNKWYQDFALISGSLENIFTMVPQMKTKETTCCCVSSFIIPSGMCHNYKAFQILLKIFFFFFTLENVDQFTWFSHMWNHQQPHLYDNGTLLAMDMMLNKNFAKVRLNIITTSSLKL